MSRRRHANADPWQSFADLAMGMLAVLLLVVVILAGNLARQAQAKSAEAEELTAFASELLEALEQAHHVEARQEGVSKWVQHLFDESQCALRFNLETGRLEYEEHSAKAAELYRPGETRLSPRAKQALASCRDSFRRLASCLSPDEGVRKQGCPDSDDPRWREKVHAFRRDVEALVLQGNTDRESYRSPADVSGDHHLNTTSRTFVANAYLGSERARQALAQLLLMVRGNEASDDDGSPLSVLLARARIESPSFGRYQVGPQAWRAKDAAACRPGEDRCANARNLALQLRFRQESLRAPFRQVVSKFCDQWARKGSQLRASLGGTAGEARARKLCANATPPPDTSDDKDPDNEAAPATPDPGSQ